MWAGRLVTCGFLGWRFQDLLDQGGEIPLHGKRLRDVVDRPSFDRFQRGFDRGVARHHEDFAAGADLLGPGQELDTVHAGHSKIRHDDLEGFILQDAKRIFGVVSKDHVVSRFCERTLDQLADLPFVVNDEDVAMVHTSHLPRDPELSASPVWSPGLGRAAEYAGSGPRRHVLESGIRDPWQDGLGDG